MRLWIPATRRITASILTATSVLFSRRRMWEAIVICIHYFRIQWSSSSSAESCVFSSYSLPILTGLKLWQGDRLAPRKYQRLQRSSRRRHRRNFWPCRQSRRRVSPYRIQCHGHCRQELFKGRRWIWTFFNGWSPSSRCLLITRTRHLSSPKSKTTTWSCSSIDPPKGE